MTEVAASVGGMEAAAASPGSGLFDDASLRPPLTPRRVILTGIGVGFLAAGIWAILRTGANPLTLWFERDDVKNLLGRMLPPRIDEPRLVWEAAIETFLMAFAGTVLGVLLALPVGFCAARNVVSNPVIRGVARGFIVLTRALPELVLALIFVRVYSIGVLPGIVALGLHSVGMLGKLYADSIEQIDEGPREGVIATGSSRMQELTGGIVPQVIPSFIAITLYRLDINFRSSTLLGLVGAGGIGLQIRAHQGSLDYEQLLGVTLVIIALIIVVEIVSTSVRGIVLGHNGTKASRLDMWLQRSPGASAFRPAAPAATVESKRPAPMITAAATGLRPPWDSQRLTMWLFSASCTVLLILSFTVPNVSFVEFVRKLPDIPATFWKLVPKSFDWWDSRWGTQLLETIAMGLAATLMALVFALPTALLAARNVAPARWVYRGSRVFILLVRALPDLIVAVIFVAALGLGPKPGVLALAIGMYGFGTKLFADAIEEVKEDPRDGVRATGASRIQETFTSVLPQAMPSIVGHSLYMLDVSLRASTVLGIVGAGGIGFTLLQGMKLLDWQLVGGLLFCIFVIVYAIELLAGWVRKQII